MRLLYHLFTFLENIRGATTDPKPTANPIAIAMKNQSISSVEAGAEGSALLEFVGQTFNGGPHNRSLPSKEVAKND